MKICNTNPHAMLAIGAAIAGMYEQPFTSLERNPKRLRDEDSETRKAMAAAMEFAKAAANVKAMVSTGVSPAQEEVN